MANEVIYDDGNISNKSMSGSAEFEFEHASTPLPQSKYDELVALGDTDGLYTINGKCYVIGERANRFGSIRHEGSNRYTSEYYQRFLAVSLYNLINRNSRSVFVYASIPPKDNAYKDAIKSIAQGDIEVTHAHNKTRRYRVTGCNTWFEPLGGVMNRLMNDDGYKIDDANISLHIGETLVIDIGGLTIDYILLENGVPDFSSARSWTERNIIDTLEDFKEAIIKRYPNELKGARDLKIDKVRDALRSGFYQAGGQGVLDCTFEADEATHIIVDAVQSRYEQYGGSTLDNVLLTGGGSGLLGDKIRERMKIKNHWRKGVFMADNENIQRANMRGAKKLLAYYKSQGVKIG